MSKPTTVTMALQEAVPEHFGNAAGLFLGRMYFLKRTDGTFDKRPYYITPETDIGQFRAWFRARMVYEPVNPDYVTIDEQ